MQFSITGVGPGDIEDGIIDRNVSITSAAANLWTSYVRLVSDLCGREPVGFSINSLAISLDLEESVNVTTLDDVLDGTATVYLAGGGVTVDIGTGVLSGAGPVGLEGVSTQQSLAALHALMLASEFNVGLRAETSRTDAADFSMDLQLTFLARAHCE